MKRRGMGKGMGSGYRNLAIRDPMVHSMSAKGIKTSVPMYARTVKTKIYTFDELDEDVQRKIIADNSDINVFNGLLGVGIYIQDFVDEGNKLGFEFSSDDVRWSILYRDSYVEINTRDLKINMEKFFGKKTIDMLEKKYDAELDYEFNTMKVGSWTDYLGGGMASGKKVSDADSVFQIKFLEYGGKSGDLIVPEKVKEKIQEKAYAKFDKLVEMSKKTFIDLEDEYIYQTSEEAIKDTLIANNYEFTKDGKMWG